jgi:cyclophilin family peptidyl-prolyl cis-trans isomerase
MVSRVFFLSLLLTLGESYAIGQESTAPPAAKPTAEAAKQSFDQLRTQYQSLTAEVQEKAQQGKPDEVAQLRGQLNATVDQIIASGLDVLRADPTSYPEVNKTLVSLAGFLVMGDAHGDGGDQFEKALPILQALLDAGVGDQTKDLWVWGGVSAFCTNKFDLAEKYLKHAASVGLFEALPREQSADPVTRVRQYGASSLRSLDSLRLAWQKEQKIRAAEAAADDLPRVKLSTSKGDIVIELFENEAPQSVANFIALVKKGYYTNVPFHRILPQFMVQGGDPTGTGGGGPGYTIRDEQRRHNYRKHFRGSLSMANTGRPNSGGSQFFLTFVPTSYLDGRHAVFGRVVEGMEHAAALKRRNADANPPHVPTPDKIISATVLRDRGHEYEFEKIPER